MSNRKWSSDQKLQTLFEGFRSWTKGGVLKEAGEQIFAPDASDKRADQMSDTGDTSGQREEGGYDPHPYMADAVKGLGPAELATALWLEVARVDKGAHQKAPELHRGVKKAGIQVSGKLLMPDHLVYRNIQNTGGTREHVYKYMKNMGISRGGDDIEQSIMKEIDALDKSMKMKIVAKSFGSGASERNAAYALGGDSSKNPENLKQTYDQLEPLILKDPISGDTFSFTVVLLDGGLGAALKIG